MNNRNFKNKIIYLKAKDKKINKEHNIKALKIDNIQMIKIKLIAKKNLKNNRIKICKVKNIYKISRHLENSHFSNNILEINSNIIKIILILSNNKIIFSMKLQAII